MLFAAPQTAFFSYLTQGDAWAVAILNPSGYVKLTPFSVPLNISEGGSSKVGFKA
jgi:hypothetical protein